MHHIVMLGTWGPEWCGLLRTSLCEFVDDDTLRASERTRDHERRRAMVGLHVTAESLEVKSSEPGDEEGQEIPMVGLVKMATFT